MSETLIPTMGLRFRKKKVEIQGACGPRGEPVFNTFRILQQRFETPSGNSVWQDVPESDGGSAQ